jgi:hypothetical protein
MDLPDNLMWYAICGLCGMALALYELYQTFENSLGKFWFSLASGLVVVLNIAAAITVYAVTHEQFGLSGAVGAIVIGLTFPAILRSRISFTLPARDGGDKDGNIAIPIDQWYRNLQGNCHQHLLKKTILPQKTRYEEITGALTEVQIDKSIEDYIEFEHAIPTLQKQHTDQHDKLKKMDAASSRLVRKAILMTKIMDKDYIDDLIQKSKTESEKIAAGESPA